MEIHGPAHLHGPQAISPPHAERLSQSSAPQRGEPICDELEISDAARAAEAQQAASAPDIRADRVAAIRAQIAAGTYETPEKLDAALDRLLDEIG